MAELPRVVDPPEGFVVTANQRTIGTVVPVRPLGRLGAPGPRPPDPRPPPRGEGRREEADARGTPRRSSSTRARRRCGGPPPRSAPSSPTTSHASSRGGTARPTPRARATSSRAPSAAPCASGRSPRGAPPPFRWHLEGDNWNALLEADDAAFRAAGLGEKASVPEGRGGRGRRRAREAPRHDRAKWSWGEANRLSVRHPLGRVPGLSWLFDPPRPAQSGAPGTPRAASPAFGQSLRSSSTGATRRPRRSSSPSAPRGTSGRRTASTSSRPGRRATPTARRRGCRARRRGRRSGSAPEERLERVGVEADEELLPHAEHRGAVVPRRPLQVVERGVLRGERADGLPLRDDDLVDRRRGAPSRRRPVIGADFEERSSVIRAFVLSSTSRVRPQLVHPGRW